LIFLLCFQAVFRGFSEEGIEESKKKINNLQTIIETMNDGMPDEKAVDK
jgi:hypothetical protein